MPSETQPSETKCDARTGELGISTADAIAAFARLAESLPSVSDLQLGLPRDEPQT